MREYNRCVLFKEASFRAAVEVRGVEPGGKRIKSKKSSVMQFFLHFVWILALLLLSQSVLPSLSALYRRNVDLNCTQRFYRCWKKAK